MALERQGSIPLAAQELGFSLSTCRAWGVDALTGKFKLHPAFGVRQYLDQIDAHTGKTRR